MKQEYTVSKIKQEQLSENKGGVIVLLNKPSNITPIKNEIIEYKKSGLNDNLLTIGD